MVSLVPSGALKSTGQKGRNEVRAKSCGVVERKLGESRKCALTTAGCGWWFLLAPTGRARDRRIARREKAPYRRKAFWFAKKTDCFTGGRCMQAWPSRPHSQTTPEGKQAHKRQAERGATATGTPEVGSHRIGEVEKPLPGWTDPPKRARRRETLGSSSSPSKPPQKGIRRRGFRVEARTSRGHLFGNKRARVHEIFECVNGSCWWCASRVCAGSRDPSRR